MQELRLFVDRDSRQVYRYNKRTDDYEVVGQALMTEDNGESYVVRFGGSNLLYKIYDTIDYGFLNFVETEGYKETNK